MTEREEQLQIEWRANVLTKLDSLDIEVRSLRDDINGMRGRLWVLSALWGAIGWGAAQVVVLLGSWK
jgi:hypothetical protein